MKQPYSKQMGREISRLIGIAHNIKHGHQQLEPDRNAQQRSEELRLARKAIEEARKAVVEVRRYKLANFSLEEIEKELLRRAKSDT